MGILNGISMSSDYIITTQDLVQEATESLGETMFKHMESHSEKLSQIDPTTDQKDSYKDLLRRCIRTAIHLQAKKVTPNDIISLCTNNHLNSAVPFIAAQFIGVKVASLDPSFSVEEMEHLLEQVRPKIIFTSEQSVQQLEDVKARTKLNFEIVVFGSTIKHTEFREFIQEKEKEAQFRPVKVKNLKETAVIYFSSGTTGLPKGICISHYSFVSQIYNAMQAENPDYEYMKEQAKRVSFPLTYLSYTSFYWISAGALLLSSIVSGFCRLVPAEFDPKETWKMIEKYKPIVLVITPIQAMEMLDYYPKNVQLQSILSVIIMGSPIPNDRMQRFVEIFSGADVIRGYGQTEICGPITLFRGNDKFQRPLLKAKTESVGLPVRGLLYKVVDLETNQNLGPNRRGELRIKSKLVMNGYYNQDSSESFDEDGWLKTGDLVYYDEDFCFYVVDRIKEAFKYKGWFIAPAMLENHLLQHPSVKQAAVIGVPKDDGYHPIGLVVLHPNCEVTEEEIEKFVEKRVPERLRLRAGVRFLDSMPVTATGKIKRREIRRKVLESLTNVDNK